MATKKKSTSSKSKSTSSSKKEDTSSKKEEETKKEDKAPKTSTANTSTKTENTATSSEVQQEPQQGAFKLISQTEEQTVRAMAVKGQGVMLQVDTGSAIGLQWIPGVHLEDNEDMPGCCKVVMGF
jgi:hypothetical protein